MADTKSEAKSSTRKTILQASAVTIRFAGDSGDGMQLTGDQFTDTAAVMGNDFATLPDFPAEIRAPAGTLPGVSSFQIQFSKEIIFTPGDLCDVLIAMNPAALKVNIPNVKKGGLIFVNDSSFDEAHLKKAGWRSDPLTDNTLKDFQLIKVPLSALTANALKDHPLKLSEVERCKNFFALGMVFWLYDRAMDHTIEWIQKRFAKRPEIVNANIAALKAGLNYADITEALPARYQVNQAKLKPGTYRKITGYEATAIGFVTAAYLANKTLFYGSYPITPASNILHELSRYKHYGVKTFQAEDEIAAVGSAVGASFGGQIGLTGTSGPGMCLKAEVMNLAVMAELPLVVIEAQRGGPSTGMPTKTEQADLLQVLFGRNGESPIAVVSPKTASDCFQMAIEAVRLAIKYMTPVVFLTEADVMNSAEPWRLPELDQLPKITATHPTAENSPFLPYARNPETLARPWAIPGTPGLEHRIGGLAKADLTGNVSYDGPNNEKMVRYRAEKIKRIANDIPELEIRGPKSGKLLVLGWGGTFGPIHQAVTNLEAEGVKVSQAHLTYLNPFPRNLGQILNQFENVLIPELNSGQLLLLIRGTFPGTHAIGLNKIQCQPFKVEEITKRIRELL